MNQCTFSISAPIHPPIHPIVGLTQHFEPDWQAGKIAFVCGKSAENNFSKMLETQRAEAEHHNSRIAISIDNAALSLFIDLG